MRGLVRRSWNALGRDGLERSVRFLLLSIIFLMPFGAAIFLVNPDSVGSAVLNTFTIPRLYVIELLIVATAALWAWLRPGIEGRLHPFKPLLGVLALAGISFWWAPYPLLAVTAFIHLFVAFLLLYMMAHELRDKKFFTQAVWALVASVSLQAVWGISQFAIDRDFGLQLIGESVLDSARLGVAKVVMAGEQHIRAYGAFPHPNLFAAYVATAIFAVGTVIFLPSKKLQTRLKEVIAGTLLGVLGVALLLTFSRAALVLVLVNGLVVILFNVRKWQRLPAAAVIAMVIFFLSAALLWQPLSGRTAVETAQETGVSNRVIGYEIALEAARNRPLGVGAGNFVPALSQVRPGLPEYQQQPAHNVPLLIAAEIGILGVALVIWFLVRTGWLFHRLRPRNRTVNVINFSLFMLSGTLLGLGLVDHFFWSLPQGLWLAVLVLAAVISRIPETVFRGREARP